MNPNFNTNIPAYHTLYSPAFSLTSNRFHLEDQVRQFNSTLGTRHAYVPPILKTGSLSSLWRKVERASSFFTSLDAQPAATTWLEFMADASRLLSPHITSDIVWSAYLKGIPRAIFPQFAYHLENLKLPLIFHSSPTQEGLQKLISMLFKDSIRTQVQYETYMVVRGARAIEKEIGVNLLFRPINLDRRPGIQPVSLTHINRHHIHTHAHNHPQRYRNTPFINSNRNLSTRREARRHSPRPHQHRSTPYHTFNRQPPPPYPTQAPQHTPTSTPPSSIPTITTNSDSDFLGDHDDPNVTAQADRAARFIMDAIAATPAPVQINTTPESETAPAPILTVIPPTPTSVGMTMERASPRPITRLAGPNKQVRMSYFRF